MIRYFHNIKTDSQLNMSDGDPSFGNNYKTVVANPLLTIAWNTGPDQRIVIDNISYDFPSNSISPLMFDANYEASIPEQIVSWQFNREFYCIVDHDKEVSCVGFIFYNNKDHMFIQLDDANQRKLTALKTVFEDEFDEENEIKEDMLRMLLKRLIILVTRVGKAQHLNPALDGQEADVVRQFNLLLEKNYKQYHQVQDYANLLNKSPKTLSNLFKKYADKTPLQVIKERLVQESKRLLYYTEMTSKEIAFELGFDDPSTFSRFFKNATSTSPTNFKKQVLNKK